MPRLRRGGGGRHARPPRVHHQRLRGANADTLGPMTRITAHNDVLLVFVHDPVEADLPTQDEWSRPAAKSGWRSTRGTARCETPFAPTSRRDSGGSNSFHDGDRFRSSSSSTAEDVPRQVASALRSAASARVSRRGGTT